MAFAEAGQGSESKGPRVSVELHRTADAVVVEVEGELDVFSAPRLRDALAEALANRGSRHIVLVLRDVSFVDGAGWRPVTDVGETLASDGDRLVIVDVSRPVRRLVELIGVDEGLEIRMTRGQAAG